MMSWRTCTSGGHSTGVSFFLCAAFTLLFLAPCCNSVTVDASGMLAIAELVAAPERYDKTMVAVVGHVAKLSVATNRGGKQFYGFVLMEGDVSVKVVGSGRAPVHEGQYVMVEGTFRRHRQIRRTVLHHQIKVTLIRPLDRLHPDLVA